MSFNFDFNGRFDFSNSFTHRLTNISPSKLAEILTRANVAFKKDWVQEYQQKNWTPMKPRFVEDTWARMTDAQRDAVIAMIPEAEAYTSKSMGKPVNQWKNGAGEYPSKDDTRSDAEKEASRIIEEINNDDSGEEKMAYIIEDMSATFTQIKEDKSRSSSQSSASEKEAAYNRQANDVAERKAKEEKQQRVSEVTAAAKTNPLYQAVRDVCVAVIAEEGMEYLSEEEIDKRIDKRYSVLAKNLDETAINKLLDAKLAKHFKETRVIVEDKAKATIKDMGIQHAMFPKLLAMVQMRKPNGTRANVMLVGPAGSGKTTAAENVAKALELPYSYVGATYDKVDLFGYNNGHGHYQVTEFYKRYKDGGVMLLDEMDGFDPAVGVATNAAIDGTRAAFPCGIIDKHTDNVNIAACNTFGLGANAKYVGRNRLDAATLNRFIKLDWGYDPALERIQIGDDKWTKITQAVRVKVDSMGIEIVISPRNGQNAVMMERTGLFSKDEIFTIAFRDGMEEDSWNQVKSVLSAY